MALQMLTTFQQQKVNTLFISYVIKKIFQALHTWPKSFPKPISIPIRSKLMVQG